MDKIFELQELEFEWDEEKYAANIWRHNVKFEEAAEVFFDNEHQYGDASVDEEFREYIVGFSFQLNLLYTVYVERGERIRIISARSATKEEEKFYERKK
jgi:uncharacterized protein